MPHIDRRRLLFSSAPLVVPGTAYDGTAGHQREPPPRWDLREPLSQLISAKLDRTGENVSSPEQFRTAIGADLAQNVLYRASSHDSVDISVEDIINRGFAIPEMFRQRDAVDHTTMFRALFASGRKLIFIPEGTYAIGGNISIPSNATVVASTGARFVAARGNISILTSAEVTTGTRWSGGIFEGNSYPGVIAFDLVGFRAEGAAIECCAGNDLSVMLNLQALCWDLSLRNIYCQASTRAIFLGEGCNAVTIDHPSINTFDEVGITVATGSRSLPNAGNNIVGGYVQGGPIGVLDQARSTSIDGTYFETCSTADVSLDGAIMPIIQRSYHSAVDGVVCVKARNVEGAQVDNVTLHGMRTQGIFDFDSSNSYCRGSIGRTAGLNTGLGDVTGLKLDRSLTGTMEPGDTGFSSAHLRPYVVTGPDSGSLIQRSYANGYEDIAIGAGEAINCLRRESVFYQVVDGGEDFTFSNLADGQSVTLMLKFTGSGVGPIKVAGVMLDDSGRANGKRKIVRCIMNARDANAIWVDEGPWK